VLVAPGWTSLAVMVSTVTDRALLFSCEVRIDLLAEQSPDGLVALEHRHHHLPQLSCGVSAVAEHVVDGRPDARIAKACRIQTATDIVSDANASGQDEPDDAELAESVVELLTAAERGGK